MGLIGFKEVFICGKYFHKMNQLAEKYWMDLSVEDKTKILLENDFWIGFSTYIYDYLPIDLQKVILLKIN